MAKDRAPLLELQDVHTSFGKVRMLRGIDLDVRDGQIVCLLGSNGAGKTTTIRTILGLIRPDQGRILFKGTRIDRYKTYQIVNAGISVVPEGRRLFPKMTVEQNLAVALPETAPADARAQHLERAFSLFPALRERLHQFAGTPSGGEQAMLAIGRALVQHPRLLILDEPSFGLAPKLVEDFYEVIEAIRAQGTTILLSEQNAGKALSIADRGYVLQKGIIVVSGGRVDLLESIETRKAYLGG